MENEKKGIKCSYAVLVIILFAALAFVTSYTFIQNKTTKCSCPDCSASGNTNVINDETEENGSSYSYENVAGMYEYDDPTGKSYIKLYLYTDGSYYYQKTVNAARGEGGYYTINDNMINLNSVFTHGSDVGRTVIFKESKLQISGDGTVVDSNPDYLFENINSVLLNKKQAFDNSQNDNSKFKETFSFGIFDVAKSEG